MKTNKTPIEGMKEDIINCVRTVEFLHGVPVKMPKGYLVDLENKLTTLTTHHQTELEREREEMLEDLHEKFPVPDMKKAEMWPHDEQVRWAGIGEVISYLNQKI